MRDLGCSKCRFAANGCARCRHPQFRPRAVAAPDEMRQVNVTQQRRRQNHAAQKEVAKERRREASRQTGEAHRELLLKRLRRQLGSEDEAPHPRGLDPQQHDAAPPAQAPKRHRTSGEGVTEPHTVSDLEQPPPKYRRLAGPSAQREAVPYSTTPPPASPGDAEASADMESECSSMQIDSGGEGEGGEGRGEGVKRGFLDMLHDNMARRRVARLSGASPPPELLGALPQPKRRRTSLGTGCSTASWAADGPAANPRAVLWEPPVSPYGLLEEELYHDPWKLLVACMLLNKTTGTQVRKIIWQLFELCPTPQAAIAADTQQIQDLIQPLGLFRKRAVAMQRLSDEYLNTQWRDPMDLHGIGKYAADAYHIFCRGRWQDVDPEDKDLKRYREWLAATGGLGTGLMRHHHSVPSMGVM